MVMDGMAVALMMVVIILSGTGSFACLRSMIGNVSYGEYGSDGGVSCLLDWR